MLNHNSGAFRFFQEGNSVIELPLLLLCYTEVAYRVACRTVSHVLLSLQPRYPFRTAIPIVASSSIALSDSTTLYFVQNSSLGGCFGGGGGNDREWSKLKEMQHYLIMYYFEKVADKGE